MKLAAQSNKRTKVSSQMYHTTDMHPVHTFMMHKLCADQSINILRHRSAPVVVVTHLGSVY